MSDIPTSIKVFLSERSENEYNFPTLIVLEDMQSVAGKNFKLIQDMTKLNPWTSSRGKLRAAIERSEMVTDPPLDRWRQPYLCTLLSQRSEAYFATNEEEQKRLSDLLNSLVTN